MKTKDISGPGFRLVRAAIVAIAAAFLAFGALAASPAPAGPRAFDTPQKAADALIKAAAANDVPALLAIFGPDGKEVVATGDDVRDKNDRARFVAKAKEKTSVTYDLADPNRAILVVGKDDWPMPVPIVKRDGKWSFDSKEGHEEILARRIGGNELNAISLLRGYVEAQKDYAEQLHDGSKVHQYAQKMISTPGKHDGLSWWNADKTPGGPIGDEIAKAIAAGYTDKTEPYNGYFFRTLTAQGSSARTGARNYIVNGAMIGGFAAMAWPANYGVTGVQTFLVNHDGVVYQKDLGPDTATVAAAIQKYDPDKTWTVTEDDADGDDD
jgi:hypothetical protein